MKKSLKAKDMESYIELIWDYLKRHSRDITRVGVYAYGHQSRKYFHIYLDIKGLEPQVLSGFESLDEVIRSMDRILDIAYK